MTAILQFAALAILGFFLDLFVAGIFDIRGPAIVWVVVIPAATAGWLVSWLDTKGALVRTARWLWAPAGVIFLAAWAANGFFDGFYNEFIDGYCGDFRCMAGTLVTAPAMSVTSYSLAALIRLRPSPTGT